MFVRDVIPRLVNIGVAESIIRAQVDNPHRQIFQLKPDIHCVTVRQGDKNKFAVLADSLNVIQTFKRQITYAAQVRIEFRNFFARVTFRSYMRQLSLRVPIEYREQFSSRVARRAYYADFYQNFFAS